MTPEDRMRLILVQLTISDENPALLKLISTALRQHGATYTHDILDFLEYAADTTLTAFAP